MQDTIARPYAQAAFDHARAESSLEAWNGFLSFFAKVTADSHIQQAASNPNISGLQLEDLLLSLSDEYSTAQKNFIKLLVQNKRLGFTPSILEQFETLRASAENRAVVEVTSAYQINESALTELSQILEKKLGSRVTLNSQVDKNLIGGIVVRVGDKVIDTTVRGKMEQFASQLAG